MESSIRRGTIEVFHSFKEADDAERRFWWNATVAERLECMEHIRRINYGDAATARLQRVFSSNLCLKPL